MDTSATSGAPSLDGIAIASGFVPVRGGPPSGCGSRRGEVAVSAATRPPSASLRTQWPSMPVGKAALGDDDPGMRRRTRERRPDDLVQHEVAERAAAVPALEALFRDQPVGPRAGVDLEPLEPVDAREAVSHLPPSLGVGEVLDEHVDGSVGKPERLEPSPSLLLRHARTEP